MKKIQIKDVKKRLRYLDRFGEGCRWDKAERFLAPLNRALFDEASRIAVTDRDKEYVNSILDRIETQETGYKERESKEKARNTKPFKIQKFKRAN
jgi:hypothetical protein